MEKVIWYIHGAHATSRSFAWLKRELPDHEHVDIEYVTDRPMANVLSELHKQLEDDGRRISIVGHSLGGVLAVSLAQRSALVDRIVTMGSPFGGSSLASIMCFFAPNTVMNEVRPQSKLLTDVRKKELTTPVLSIVTTGGQSPMIPESNDGVVSVVSQKALYGPRYVERPVNHFEVLLDGETAQLISDFIW